MAMTSVTSTMTAPTAFNIFINKCREEQKRMFPEELLGKPRVATYAFEFYSPVILFKTTSFLHRNVLRGGKS